MGDRTAEGGRTAAASCPDTAEGTGTVCIGKASPPRGAARVEEVQLRCGAADLAASLFLPDSPHGVVLFAHGSGSSRHSSRNRHVADLLARAGLASLLLDLLTPQEERVDRLTREHRFDIGRLTQRFEQATRWVQAHERLHGLRVGYFGASTGSAVALSAAARLGEEVSAVVSRGGRPDLAGDAELAAVRAPTLLIVGGADGPVIALNERAGRQLRCEHELVVIDGATHLFEEPGALEQVAARAQTWFHQHLVRLETGR